MNKIIRLISCLIIFFSFLLQIYCNPREKESDSGIIVAVSIVPQRTFVKAIAGPRAKIVVMVPPGFSPANYEPKPVQMEEFSKAKIYFAIGIPTEKSNILPKAKNKKIIMVHEEVAKSYPERKFSTGARDPHIWLSPKRVKAMAEIIARELAAIDPANKKEYEKNAGYYINELDKADREIKATVKGMNSRKFIVFHPAYGYFADDYKLEMHALEHDGKEASPVRLKKMIDFAKKENIKVIFYQAEISDRQAQSFADEIGGKTIKLSPLSPDYINNLKNIAETFRQLVR